MSRLAAALTLALAGPLLASPLAAPLAYADPGPTPTPLAAARSHLAKAGIGSPETLIPTSTDAVGDLMVQRFQQVHDGIPVLGAQYLVRVRRTKAGVEVLGGSGEYRRDLAPDTSRLVSASAARLVATRTLAGTWARGYRIADRGGVILPQGRGILTRQLTVTGRHADGTPMREQVFVGSTQGRVALAYDDLHTFKAGPGAPVDTTGVSVLGKTRPLHVTQSGPDTWTLLDQSRTSTGGGTIETFDAKGADFMGFIEGWDDQAKVVTSDHIPLTRADNKSGQVDAHWGASQVYDFYAALGRNGLDGRGGPIKQVVGVTASGRPYPNAFWQGSFMVYGGRGDGYRPFSSDLDVVGHEITHGITDKTSGLIGAGQPGAMNEAFSDYFGNAIANQSEGLATSDPKSGLMGENLCRKKGPWRCAIRDLNKRVTTADYQATQEDNGGVHDNSVIVGGTLWQIRKGLGDSLADRLMLRVLTGYLTPLAGFTDLRTALTDAAGEMGLDAAQQAVIVDAFDDHGISRGWERRKLGWDSRTLVRDVSYPFTNLTADHRRFAYANYTASGRVGVYLGSVERGGAQLVSPRDKHYYDSVALGGGRLLWLRAGRSIKQNDVQVKNLATGKVEDLGELGGGLGISFAVSRTTAAWLAAETDDVVNVFYVHDGKRTKLRAPKGWAYDRLALHGDTLALAMIDTTDKSPYAYIKTLDARTGKMRTIATVRSRQGGRSPFIDDIAMTKKHVVFAADAKSTGSGSQGASIMRVGRHGGRPVTLLAEGNRLAPISAELGVTDSLVAWSSAYGLPHSDAEPGVWWLPMAGGKAARYSCGAGFQSSPAGVTGRRLVFWDMTTGTAAAATRARPHQC